jgi:hypothetical protein
MRTFRKLSLAAVLGSAVIAALVACGNDDENIVRTRGDGGTLEASVEGGPGALTCGATVATTYVSPTFAMNAQSERDLGDRVVALGAKMQSAEGTTSPAVVTTADLQAIFTAGAPSLRSVASAFAQSTVDTYLTQFGDAATRTWTPSDAEAEGGTSAGGKYAGTSIVNGAGLDLRAATEKVLLNGSLYEFALVLTSGPISEAAIDRLLALFGATPAFANGADAGADSDRLIASYAANRDDKTSAGLGPYRKVRNALLVAKAASTNPDKCRDDLLAAFNLFLPEWEKAAYLSVIYFLNQAATSAVASPPNGPAALHAFGSAIGFVESFKTIPLDRRKINDQQIDDLLNRIGAAAPYQLITKTSERVVAFNTAFQDIGAIYGLTQTQIEDAKKSY